MAATKESKPEKKHNNVESRRNSNMKATNKQTTKGKSKSNNEKGNKKKQSDKRKVANALALVLVPSSNDSGDGNASELQEVAENNMSTSSNGRTSKAKSKTSKGMKRNIEEGNEETDTLAIPMNRIRTIIKGQGTAMSVSNEAVFAINKATEKFLERFTKDAYASFVEDRKKALAYKHLASAVSNQRKYDFLSDFVPEQVMAEDALRERNLAEQTPV